MANPVRGRLGVSMVRGVQPAGRVVLPAVQEGEMTEQDREFWMLVRQGILLIVDAIERWLGIRPRTSELRKELKELREQG